MVAGCNKTTNTETAQAPPQGPKAGTSSGLVQTSAASARNATTVIAAATAPKVKRVALPGIYFMTKRVSKMTEDGVFALTPGTQVRLVGQPGKKMTVETSQGRFQVTSDQVTTDPGLADQFAANKAQAQTTIADTQAQTRVQQPTPQPVNVAPTPVNPTTATNNAPTYQDDVASAFAKQFVEALLSKPDEANFQKVKILQKEGPAYVFHVVVSAPGAGPTRVSLSYLVCFKVNGTHAKFNEGSVVQEVSDPPTDDEIEITKSINRNVLGL
jgi:hypothetical protein